MWDGKEVLAGRRSSGAMVERVPEFHFRQCRQGKWLFRFVGDGCQPMLLNIQQRASDLTLVALEVIFYLIMMLGLSRSVAVSLISQQNI